MISKLINHERILIGLNNMSAPTFDAGYKVIEEVVMCGSVALLVEVCCSEETTTMVGGGGGDDRQPLDLSSTAVSDQQLEPLLSFMSSVVHVMTDQHDKQFSNLMLEVAIFTLEELDAAGGIPQSIMDIIITGTSSWWRSHSFFFVLEWGVWSVKWGVGGCYFASMSTSPRSLSFLQCSSCVWSTQPFVCLFCFLGGPSSRRSRWCQN